jgi:hypothetical protein
MDFYYKIIDQTYNINNLDDINESHALEVTDIKCKYNPNLIEEIQRFANLKTILICYDNGNIYQVTDNNININLLHDYNNNILTSSMDEIDNALEDENNYNNIYYDNYNVRNFIPIEKIETFITEYNIDDTYKEIFIKEFDKVFVNELNKNSDDASQLEDTKLDDNDNQDLDNDDQDSDNDNQDSDNDNQDSDNDDQDSDNDNQDLDSDSDSIESEEITDIIKVDQTDLYYTCIPYTLNQTDIYLSLFSLGFAMFIMYLIA